MYSYIIYNIAYIVEIAYKTRLSLSRNLISYDIELKLLNKNRYTMVIKQNIIKS